MLLKNASITLLSVFIFFLLSCGGNSSSDPNEPQPKFYSTGNLGKWEVQAPTHTAQITRGQSDDADQIHVKVPFEANPGHYIEAILLTDENHKELAKKTLGKSVPPTASFKLPTGNHKKFYIVIKCNLHDMWETEVKLN